MFVISSQDMKANNIILSVSIWHIISIIHYITMKLVYRNYYLVLLLHHEYSWHLKRFHWLIPVFQRRLTAVDVFVNFRLGYSSSVRWLLIIYNFCFVHNSGYNDPILLHFFFKFHLLKTAFSKLFTELKSITLFLRY